MKQIINNKIYDTEKAEEIYEYKHSFPVKNIFTCIESCEWEEATIYKTSKNNYFIYFSCELRPTRERIEETTLDNVKEVIKELDPDKYIEIFGNIDLEEA